MRLLTIGTFDCFHYGHLRLLQRAAMYGHRLYVGVNSDRFVAQFKGPTLINEAQRMAIVGGIRVVDEVFLNDGPGRALIERVQPNALVIGSDWHERSYLAQIGLSQEEIDGLSVGVLYLPRTPDISTSEIRGRIG